MPKQVLQTLEVRLADAERLIEIHEETTGIQAGRRFNFDALNRSAVMLAIAAWEGFAEDLLKYGAKFLAQRLNGPSALPENVRNAMIAQMHTDGGWSKLTEKSKRGIWSISGSGWRAAYLRYANGRIQALNTPNHDNLKKLFSSVVGLSDFAQNWGAKRWSRDAYVTKLDEALKLRHRIAHGTLGTETVGKGRAKAAIALVRRTAGWTSHAVDAHISGFDMLPKPRSNPSLRSAMGEMNRSDSD